MDMHAHKTAPGWERLLDRIRKLFETPPPPRAASRPQTEHVIVRRDDLTDVPGVSSR